MTAQIPDRLVNKHPRIKFNNLYVYAVIRGDPRKNHGWGDPFIFDTRPCVPGDVARISFLHRRYIATFLLQSDGRVLLKMFCFPLRYNRGAGRNTRKQRVNEHLVGDFWLVMKPECFAPRTYVPFRDGVIVEDRDQWYEEPPLAPAPARSG